jgi:hypothetical protein
VTDVARTLLVAAAASLAAGVTFVFRLRSLEGPAQRIAELRAANVAAIVLAATGASAVGFAVAQPSAPTAALEVAIGLLFVGAAGWMLLRDPHDALLIASVAFLAHAAVDLAHRPGWLSTGLMPHGFLVGAAVYDASIAALCFLARWQRHSSGR